MESQNKSQLKQQFSISYHYNVDFSENIFSVDNPIVENYICSSNDSASGGNTKKILVIIDDKVASLHSDIQKKIITYFEKRSEKITLVTPPVVITGGEGCKNNPQLVDEVYQLVNEKKICRHSYVVVIGGGSLIDMVGYATATAHRGIRLIRIPTTFLAQADASIGVKNSINLFGKKNFIGTFTTPHVVINDFEFLSTLPETTLREGLSEAIKVALIKDDDFFWYIKDHVSQINNNDKEVLQKIIFECARLHLDHICNNGDPFEKGSSRPLDFGHWSAHKLEQLSNHRITHGQAVVIGIAVDCMYAFLEEFLPEKKLKLILNLFLDIGLNIFDEALLIHLEDKNKDNVLKGLAEFREHLGGELTVLLLKDINVSVEVNSIKYQTVISAIHRLRDYQLEYHK